MPKRDDNKQYIKISELTPYENNARTHSNEQIEAICNSIKEFGFINPVIIDENNMILVGHGRIEAAKVLGLDEAPYRRVTNLTEDQKRAYILADNKLSDLGGWDEDLLAQELGEIELDMSLFGFDNVELDEINITDDSELDEIPDGDFDDEPKAKRGEIYKLGNHFLMCGDATSETDIKALLSLNGNNTVDMCLTDAPYGISVVSKDGKVGADFGIAKKGDYIEVKGDDTTDTAEKAYNIIKDYSKKQILFGGNYFIKFLPFSDSWIVWDKRCDTGIKNTFADGEMAWLSFHSPIRIYRQLWNGMIREGEHDKRVHPTQKPVKMLSEILRDFTKEDETVLDCFGGSGSTLIACEQTGRSCFMIEYEPYYIDVIIQRWENLTGKKAELIKEA